DVLDLLPGIVQHHAPLERGRAQMGRQQRKILRGQRRQESVESSVEGGHTALVSLLVTTARQALIRSDENRFLGRSIGQRIYVKKVPVVSVTLPPAASTSLAAVTISPGATFGGSPGGARNEQGEIHLEMRPRRPRSACGKRQCRPLAARASESTCAVLTRIAS